MADLIFTTTLARLGGGSHCFPCASGPWEPQCSSSHGYVILPCRDQLWMAVLVSCHWLSTLCLIPVKFNRVPSLNNGVKIYLHRCSLQLCVFSTWLCRKFYGSKSKVSHSSESGEFVWHWCLSSLLSWTHPAQTMKTFPTHLSRVLTEINNSALSNGKSLGSCESYVGSFI